MARKPNSIMDITDEKETWRIGVRVINMWNIPRAPRFNIEILLMDQKADKIVAQIKNVDPKKWNDVLKVGKTYMIQNFEVENNTGQFRAAKHAFKLNFVKATKIKEQDFPLIPEMVYDFTLFDDVLTGKANPDYLIDVIGELVDVLQWSLDGKPKKVVFTMKDKCGTIISCTLWETFAFQLKDYVDKHDNEPIILLLHLAKIKEARGAYAVSIQNSMYGSRVFINEDLKEIEEYKNGLDPSQLSLVTSSQRMSQISYSSQITLEDKFLYNAQVKSLSELCELKKECVCVTVATITKLLVANGWIYEGCPKCNKKVDYEEFPYTCQGCGNESATTVARFRLEVRVAQPNETANFILWDRECNALIKESATEIKQNMIDQEGEFDPKDIPEVIDRVLGKKLAFRFKAMPNSTRYSVTQLSENEDIIISILNRLPANEVPEIEPRMSDSTIKKSDDLVYTQQSLSATGEFDPESSKSVTPAKREFVASESQLEPVPFEDLESIQLFSSRLSKHIKS